MHEKPYFLINDNEIYLDQVLVEYLNIPIFFICKAIEDYYVGLCTDGDAQEHLLVRVNKKDIYEVLHGVIPMREIFLKQKSFWNINSGDTLQTDMVEEFEIANIDMDVLPDEGAYFKILTPEIQKYAQKYDMLFEETIMELAYESKNITSNSEYMIETKLNDTVVFYNLDEIHPIVGNLGIEDCWGIEKSFLKVDSLVDYTTYNKKSLIDIYQKDKSPLEFISKWYVNNDNEAA